ncbi:MAG TPA: two-component regulator propeller domain-containing protein [Desulfuromonadaceae bacterium]|nr:two-component regulator propeller domain-containing protein [Desulfuromonadaceae bacterium]
MPCFLRYTGIFGIVWAGYFLSFPAARAAIINSPEYYIQSMGIPDGLPHEMAHHIVQDQTGFLWISTSGGLVRFDGHQFQTITSPLLNNQESDLLYAICRGTNGSLWAAPNRGGLVEFNGRTKSFLQIVPPTVLPAHPPTFVAQTSDGAFWVGDFQSELRRWKDGDVTAFTNGLAIGQTISMAVDRSNDVYVASGQWVARYENGKLVPVTGFAGTRARLGRLNDGQVWVATAENVQKIDDGRATVVYPDPPWASAGGVPTAVFGDSRNVVWVGTRGQGLYRLENGNFAKVPTSHPWITDLCEDNEGNIWATTHGGGINRIRLKSFSNWNSQVGGAEDGFRSVCEDRHGNFWLADVLDDQVVELPRGHHKREFQSDRVQYLRVVCADAGNQVWIATRSTLLRWSGGPDFNPEMVVSNSAFSFHSLYAADNGDVWAGGDGGLLGRCHEGRWEQFDEIRTNYGGILMRAIAEDGQGNLWVAMNMGGLLCYHDGHFTRFEAGNDVPASTIHCFLRDATGAIWMATTRDGLLFRDGQKFRRITVDQGFPGGIVDQMLEDGLGRIWFATETGFYHVDRDELVRCARGKVPVIHPIAYGHDVGLIGYSPVSGFQPMAWKSRDGLLIFTTHKGVISIDPAAHRLSTEPPPVLVDEILMNDQKIAARDGIVLPAWAKKLEFRMAAIEFSAPDQVKIRHWLEGFDSDWVDLGNERSFSYPKLPPGKYRLRVSVRNPDGIWGEAVTPFSVTVVPAWWQLWWAQAVAGLIAALFLTLAVRTWSHRRLRLRLERLEEKQAMERERGRIAKDLHDDLGGTLTEIGLLADLAARDGNPPDQLKSATAYFSQRVRNLARTLDTVVWAVNPKNDSLDELVTYLCGFSQELFSLSAIRFRLDVVGDIPAIGLTPEERSNLFLTAKEALNNVIKHSRATEARLRIRMAGNRFTIAIEDNGLGFDPTSAEATRRNGLANMRSRIEEAGGTFQLESQPGKGTTILMSLCFDARARLN